MGKFREQVKIWKNNNRAIIDPGGPFIPVHKRINSKGKIVNATVNSKKETPKRLAFRGYSVESEGFEPSSKQAIAKLSTRLFFDWFSI